MAEKYAESARKLDSYNPHAFVNSGVCEMLRERYDIAKFMFNNALEIDASLFEALYNMGKFTFTHLSLFVVTCRVKCVWS